MLLLYIFWILDLVSSFQTSYRTKDRRFSLRNDPNDETFEPIIAEFPKLPNMMTKAKSKNGIQSALEYNWIAGHCSHSQIFEATQTIQRLRFVGDLLAFSMLDGRVTLIRMSSGEILDKYAAHKSEATALYFDGVHLMSGGGDGILHIYNVTFSSPRRLGNTLKSYNLHSGMITGLKCLRSFVNNKESLTIVTCGADRKLIGVDMQTYVTRSLIIYILLICRGVIKFSTSLNSNPISMDIMNNYIAVGMQDGRVLFFTGSSGKQMLQFQAHSNKVNSIHFVSESVLLTGGFDGTVRRWDISGENIAKPKPSRIIDFYFRDVLINEYTKDSFHAKESFIQDLPAGSFKVYRDQASPLSSVVCVQGDEKKIVAAYRDGSIRVWDSVACITLFEMKGRSSQITTVQYDATRYCS